MQISANNILLAAQQALTARPATPNAFAAQPFEPADFAVKAEARAQTAPQRPGSQIDIRI
jgi:hypothetical protein